MKVVLFCGGLGTRLREYSETIPKPMANIGYRPILWHLMKYYAHFGHTEFILCLGYRGDLIKQYFLDYNECLSNDFELSGGGKHVRLYGRDIDQWKITFADTGLHSNIGQRLKAVQRYLGDDPIFLANYSDGLAGRTRSPASSAYVRVRAFTRSRSATTPWSGISATSAAPTSGSTAASSRSSARSSTTSRRARSSSRSPSSASSA